jgi:adenylate kinase family enzyme
MTLPDGQRSLAMDCALDFMRRGELVPDQTVLDMVGERLRCLHCCGGFLLDGFPRTVVQAEALEKLMQQEDVALTAVLNYELPMDEIVARISGRRTCSGCKAVYHVASRRRAPKASATVAAENCSSAKMTGPNPSACGWRPMKKAPGR